MGSWSNRDQTLVKNSARDFSCVQIELVRVRDLISSSEGAEHIKI